MPDLLNGRGIHPAPLIEPVEPSETASPTVAPAIAPPDAQDDWSYATEELLDSLPQVWTRGLLYVLLLFVTVLVPWALFSRVDETGTARGRLEPQGQTLQLDSEVTGAIATIQVKEGDRVTAGQPLLTLDADLVEVELRQRQDQRQGQQDHLAQLNLLRNQLIATLATQRQQNQAQALEKETQIEQSAQQLEHAKTEQELAAINLARAEQELARFETLYQQGIIPEVEVIEHRDLLLERRQLHEQAQADVTQASLQQQEHIQNSEGLLHTNQLSLLQIEEELKNLETQITQLTSEISQSTRQIEALQLQLEQRVITSPVAGVVFELPFQQVGAVVEPSDRVAEIAPEGANLIVHAEISTAESGSLRQGLPVKLKFDAYPFQDYGVAMGTVTTVSPTARVDETAQDNVDTYELEIELDHPCLPAPQECIELRPGDTATAEVIVRQRRIIDIVLNPFRELGSGGLQL
ncbi:MAG: HlyD family efflux transporter periplasmic adaptor subunit [Leptolyngbya sp. SIO1E4]|nr:HlyD family efflux transporter periplasmic adaptor subunit [Leptolyngbya sp. SIO1E4]